MRTPPLTTAAHPGILLLVLTGCGDPDAGPHERSATLQEYFDEEAVDSSHADSYAEIEAARLTETGRYIVVLDAFPPFIRIRDSNGVQIRSFGDEGRGPGELRRPYSLAVQGDSVIAVLNANGVVEFSFDGELVGSAPPLPLYGMGITADCGGGWLVFGPRHIGGSDPDGNPWILRLPRLASMKEPAAAATVAFRDTVFPARFTRRGTTQAASGGGRFAFLRIAPERQLLVGDCASGEVRQVDHGLEYAGEDVREMGPADAAGGRSMRMRMHPGPRHQGMGILSEGVLLARHAWFEPDLPTVLTLVGRADSAAVDVEEGVVVLQDGKPGVGALFSTNAPWPRLVFVPESVLVSAFATMK